METATLFNALAFIFTMILYLPYARAIRASAARPTLSSWISWLIMDVAILAGMLAKGVFLWQMAAYIIGCAWIIRVTWKKGGALGWKPLDTVCVSAVALSAALWWLTGDAEIAIIVSLAAMIVGTVPLFRNLLEDPKREPLLPWSFALLGGIFGFLAIPAWTVAGAATPSVFLALQTLVIALMSRRWMLKQKPA